MKYLLCVWNGLNADLPYSEHLSIIVVFAIRTAVLSLQGCWLEHKMLQQFYTHRHTHTYTHTKKKELADFISCLWRIERDPRSHSCHTGEGGALQRQMFSGWFLRTKWQQVKCKAEWWVWETGPVDGFLTFNVKWHGSFSLFPQKASLSEVALSSANIADRPVDCPFSFFLLFTVFLFPYLTWDCFSNYVYFTQCLKKDEFNIQFTNLQHF